MSYSSERVSTGTCRTYITEISCHRHRQLTPYKTDRLITKLHDLGVKFYFALDISKFCLSYFFMVYKNIFFIPLLTKQYSYACYICCSKGKKLKKNYYVSITCFREKSLAKRHIFKKTSCKSFFDVNYVEIFLISLRDFSLNFLKQILI